MAMRILRELSSLVSRYFPSRSRGDRLFRCLGGLCGSVREERVWFKGLEREFKGLSSKSGLGLLQMGFLGPYGGYGLIYKWETSQ